VIRRGKGEGGGGRASREKENRRKGGGAEGVQFWEAPGVEKKRRGTEGGILMDNKRGKNGRKDRGVAANDPGKGGGSLFLRIDLQGP